MISNSLTCLVPRHFVCLGMRLLTTDTMYNTLRNTYNVVW